MYVLVLVQGSVSFLPSGKYGAMFQNCAEYRVDDIEMFLFFPRPLLLFLQPHW